eukprot:1161073-Pelagomonas_calceolata.AAC.5
MDCVITEGGRLTVHAHSRLSPTHLPECRNCRGKLLGWSPTHDCTMGGGWYWLDSGRPGYRLLAALAREADEPCRAESQLRLGGWSEPELGTRSCRACRAGRYNGDCNCLDAPCYLAPNKRSVHRQINTPCLQNKPSVHQQINTPCLLLPQRHLEKAAQVLVQLQA